MRNTYIWHNLCRFTTKEICGTNESPAPELTMGRALLNVNRLEDVPESIGPERISLGPHASKTTQRKWAGFFRDALVFRNKIGGSK